jgi:hypothetical protein
MARRKKHEAAEFRTAFAGFQLMPTERAELERRAAVTGRKLSDYCRIVLLSDIKAPAPSVRDPAAINALVIEFVREGNNLNQLARIANERHDLPSAQALGEVLALIKAGIAKVLAL